MKECVTKKGTRLPLMDIHGKEYLQVAHRLVWFREEHPDWGIETEVKTDGKSSSAKAIIRDSNNRIIACAHKSESAQGFHDHYEKSETGAIGRALAYCGYGTQFAPEFIEGDRIADSPVSTKKSVEAINSEFDRAADQVLSVPNSGYNVPNQVNSPPMTSGYIAPSLIPQCKCGAPMKRSKGKPGWTCPNWRKGDARDAHPFVPDPGEEYVPPPNKWDAAVHQEQDVPF